MSKSICIVIVTYNRCEYLLNLLNALLNQSTQPEAILIFDNYSSDNTIQKLRDFGLDFMNTVDVLQERTTHKGRFLYYRNGFNSGGSGGFYSGIKLASEMNFDYIWCMDDDVLPDKECLEVLMENVSENNRIVIPTRTDDKYKDFAVTKVNMSNPFIYKITSRKTWLYNEEIKGDVVEIVDMPFEGPLIANSLVKEIGLPNKDLFIIFDDSEYAYRASKKTKLLYCKKAVLHKQIIPVTSSDSTFNWKNYYGWRNQFWFDKEYGTNVFVKLLRPYFQSFDLYLRAIVKGKWSNIKVVRRALHDANKNLLGKLVEPGTKGEDF